MQEHELRTWLGDGHGLTAEEFDTLLEYITRLESRVSDAEVRGGCLRLAYLTLLHKRKS